MEIENHLGSPLDIVMQKDVARAETLPSRVYCEPRYLETEKEKVFFASWQVVARVDQFPEVGSFLATDLLGEPVLLVRGETQIQAFANVCRHRASLIADGAGKAKCFQCPYHGWTYALDGQLLGAPEFENTAAWDSTQVRLPKYDMAVFGPFVFARLVAARVSLVSVLGAIPQEIQRAGYEMGAYAFLFRREFEVECNWKNYVDNYLEGYHLPRVHPELFRELDYAAYRVETHRYYSAQIAPLRKSPLAGTSRFNTDREKPALYYWLFPNLMLNIYSDIMNANLVIPLGPERTLVTFDWFSPSDKKRPTEEELERLTRFSHQIQLEDVEICERVQKGLRSRSYERGRYSALRENGVHHFHQLWSEFCSRRDLSS